MSIESRLANARQLAARKRYAEAIAEYEFVLDLDPGNAEALEGLAKLKGASSMSSGSLDEGEPLDSGKRIKTDFFAHQAAESSTPLTRRGPVLVVLVVLGIGVLLGIWQAVIFFLNYDNIQAMKNVAVKLKQPVQKDGVAYVDVEIDNYNPAPIKDTAFRYAIMDQTGSTVASGVVSVPTAVPAGDSRTMTEVKLGPVSKTAGRMHAELVDLKYGPKPALAPELAVKFVEAAAMKDAEAIDAFTEFVKAAPDFAPGYVGLGQALAAGNNMDLAVKAYEKAIKLDPSDANAHYNLGVALFYKADRDGARREIEESARLAPDDPSVKRAMAELIKPPPQSKTAPAGQSYAAAGGKE